MIKETLLKIFERDLIKLEKEIEAYSNEQNIWITTNEVKNSAGNLSLHLVGNLKAFVGNEIGGIAYTRDRKAEFEDLETGRASKSNRSGTLYSQRVD